MTDYKKQATDFLTKHGLILKINTAVPQKSPLWSKDGKHGVNYWVTLSENKTGGKSYSFDFWGSIADKENNFRGFPKPPTAYDILACLHVDELTSFDDFCSTYGYDNDSITAKRTFQAVTVQNEKLRELLSEKALNELDNIN